MDNTVLIVGLIILCTNLLVRLLASLMPDDNTEQIMPRHVLPMIPPPPPPPPLFYFFDTETPKIHAMRSKKRYAKCSHCGQPGAEMSTCTHCGAHIYYQ